MMCGSTSNGNGLFCRFDGGGPVLIKGSNSTSDIQVGLINNGQCGDENYPDVYVKVDGYVDFIECVTSGGSNDCGSVFESDKLFSFFDMIPTPIATEGCDTSEITITKKLGTATLCMFTFPIFVFYMTLPLFVNYFVKEEPMVWSEEDDDFDNKDNDRYLKDKNTGAVLVAGKYLKRESELMCNNNNNNNNMY